MNEDPARPRRLIATRGGNRTVVTRLEKQANEIIVDLQDAESNADNLMKLESIATTLKEKKAYLAELNKEIIDNCPIEEIEKEIVESAEWDSRINEILEKIKCLKKGSISQPNACGAGRETSTPIRARRSTEDDHELASNGNVFNQSSASTASNGGMRLPKLNLPRYNGDVTRYTSFWQRFESSIYNNDTISPVNKLNYLVNLLGETLHRTLAGLELTEEN